MVKTIILSGATSGIGMNLRDTLHAEGYNIISVSRRKDDFPGHRSADISEYSSLKRIYKELVEEELNVYALINCAGIASMNLALTTPHNVTERILSTNLKGTIFFNQVFSPLLIRNKVGRVINFSTIAVRLGLAGESVYVASKAGVEGFSRALSNEVSPFGITVNCIAPGPIKTNLLNGITESQIQKIVNSQIIKKMMSPKDISDIVKFLLSPDSANITGQVFNVGGF